MAIFLLTLGFLLIVVAAMAVGVIFSNKPIKGSCGGIQNLGLGGECEICGGDMSKCDEQENSEKREVSPDMFVDATNKSS